MKTLVLYSLLAGGLFKKLHSVTSPLPIWQRIKPKWGFPLLFSLLFWFDHSIHDFICDHLLSWTLGKLEFGASLPIQACPCACTCIMYTLGQGSPTSE